MKYFCTSLDKNYLLRGLALFESLKKTANPFVLQIVCLDPESHKTIKGLGDNRIHAISLEAVEEMEPGLTIARGNRSRYEYYFTLSAWIIRKSLENVPPGRLLSYVDADLYFFNPPDPVYKEMEGFDVGITPHRYPPRLANLNKTGIYNIGWLVFRSAENAQSCLATWGKQCLEWCYDRFEDGKYADQKYLDAWPGVYPFVKVIEHPGANIGPWCAQEYLNKLNRIANSHKNDYPPICYHYHGFQNLNHRLYKPNLRHFSGRPSAQVLARFYDPYVRALESVAAQYQISPYTQETRFWGTSESRSGHGLIFRISAFLRQFIRLLKGEWVLKNT